MRSPQLKEDVTLVCLNGGNLCVGLSLLSIITLMVAFIYNSPS